MEPTRNGWYWYEDAWYGPAPVYLEWDGEYDPRMYCEDAMTESGESPEGEPVPSLVGKWYSKVPELKVKPGNKPTVPGWYWYEDLNARVLVSVDWAGFVDREDARQLEVYNSPLSYSALIGRAVDDLTGNFSDPIPVPNTKED